MKQLKKRKRNECKVSTNRAPSYRCTLYKHLHLDIANSNWPGHDRSRSIDEFVRGPSLPFIPRTPAFLSILLREKNSLYVRRASAKRAMSQQRFPYVTILKGNFNKKKKMQQRRKVSLSLTRNTSNEFNSNLTRTIIDWFDVFLPSFHFSSDLMLFFKL